MGGQGTWTPTKRRGPIAAEFTTPGPASIALPSTIGTSGLANKPRSPAFTITSRHEVKQDLAGPGPGTYNVTGVSNKGKEEPNAPSMHIKPKDPKVYVTPAPCDYSPEKGIRKVVDASPAFSFGTKTELHRSSDAPSPNSYSIPTLMGSCKEGSRASAPSFTIPGRPREMEDKMRVPGPGTYNEAAVDAYKTDKSPAFSMGQRTILPSDHTMKPGPGAHSPEKCILSTGPKYTISPRPKPTEDKMKVPGPGTYDAGDLDKCKAKLPAFSLGIKTELPLYKSRIPAPNSYSPEKCLQDSGPKYTMAPRPKPEQDKMKVPGPGAYEVGNLDKCRTKLPAFTMAAKTSLPTDKTKKPAPNAYSPGKCEVKKMPQFSFGIRHSVFLGKLRDV